MKQSTRIIFLGLIIMGALTLYVIDKSPSFESALEKQRPVDRVTDVQLAVFEKIAEGEFAPILGNIKPGMALVFTLSSNVPLHVALLAVVDDKSPKILFEEVRIPPGSHKQLEAAGVRFVFNTLPGQRNIRFCIVQGSNSQELSTKLLRPKNTWFRLPEKQCVDVAG